MKVKMEVEMKVEMEVEMQVKNIKVEMEVEMKVISTSMRKKLPLFHERSIQNCLKVFRRSSKILAGTLQRIALQELKNATYQRFCGKPTAANLMATITG